MYKLNSQILYSSVNQLMMKKKEEEGSFPSHCYICKMLSDTQANRQTELHITSSCVFKGSESSMGNSSSNIRFANSDLINISYGYID